MIFSNSTSEIYYLLSKMINCYDIFILKKIINEKKRLEDNETFNWYVDRGDKLKKLSEKRPRLSFLINKNLNNNLFHITHDKLELIIKSLSLCKHSIQVLSFDGFILNYKNNIYSNPSLKEKCETLNYFTKEYGIYEIIKKKFNYQCFILTDLVGNKCIRSIIRKKQDNKIIYEYKTISVNKNGYSDPVERYLSIC